MAENQTEQVKVKQEEGLDEMVGRKTPEWHQTMVSWPSIVKK